MKCSDRRALASHIIGEEYVLKVDFGHGENELLVETRNRDKFFSRLPEIFVQNRIEVDEITSPDDNLQAVFDYLIGK